MKVLVVLVLAVFTGCNANLLYADAPKSKLDELTDAFSDSVDTLTKPAEDFLDRLGQTKFGQDLNARLEEGANVVKTNIERIDKALGQPFHDIGESFGMMLYGIALSLEEKEPTIRKHLEPVAEKVAPVAEKILGAVTERTQRVRDLAVPYVNKVTEKVNSWSQALSAHLDTLYDSIYS